MYSQHERKYKFLYNFQPFSVSTIGAFYQVFYEFHKDISENYVGKFVSVHAMTALHGVEMELQAFLTSTYDVKGSQLRTLVVLVPGQGSLYALNKRLWRLRADEYTLENIKIY